MVNHFYLNKFRLLKEKMFFTRRLAVMVKAGVPLVEALTTLAEQTRSTTMKRAIKRIVKDVSNGQSLTASFKKFPNVFDEFYIGMISSGESSGTLEQNLHFLSQQLQKETRLRNNISSALLYPTIVLAALVAMVLFVMIFVFPELSRFFNSIQQDLPPLTRALIGIMDFLALYWFVLLAALIVAIIGITYLARITAFGYYWHTLILNLPIAGRIVRTIQLERFARNLGLLLKSGVPAATCLEITAATLTNHVFKRHTAKLSSMLRSGVAIGDSIQKTGRRIYPSLTIEMIVVGEKSGSLDENLLYLADFYADESDDNLRNLSTVLEPVLLIILGVAIGLIAIAIISPIYNLTAGLERV